MNDEMVSYDSDEEFDKLIQESINQADSTIKHLRLQYELSLQHQTDLEKQLSHLKSHKCTVAPTSTKQVQCPTPFHNLCDAYCQTERYSPDSDDRFYQRVDEIVNQNKELHSNIDNLQQQLEKLDASRKTMRSDFHLKHSEAIERMKILESKREKSYHSRIQMLEGERTNSLCSLTTMSSVDSGSYSEGKANGQRAGNLDFDKEEFIAKNGEEILKNIEEALTNMKSKSTNAADVNKIRFERDTALKKCVKLDSQLASVKKNKEASIEQITKLEEELQSLRLFYNLHQSLSQEASLRDQYNSQVSELTERLKQREAELLASQRENDALAAMVKRLEQQLTQADSMPNGYSPRSTNRSAKRISSSSTVSSLM